MKKLYDVHILADATVLGDIITYAEEHGSVLAVLPYKGTEPPPPKRRKRASTARQGVDGTVLKIVSQYEHHTAKQLGELLSTYSSYEPNSIHPALHRLSTKSLVVRDASRPGPTTFVITEAGKKELQRELQNGS